MAAVKTVDQQIDHMAELYGSAKTHNRAKMLSLLQEAEEELWHRAPFQWRHKEATFAFIAAQASYTMDPTVASVLNIWSDDGALMEKIPEHIFDRYYRTTILGTPTRWASQSVDSSRLVVVRIWAQTSSNVNGTYQYEVQPAALVDAASSVSNFPEGKRMLPVLVALKKIAQTDGRLEKAAMFDRDAQQMMGDLFGKSQEKVGVT